MKLPRMMIAAPSSGSGKTLITCGILECLKKTGMRPGAFKCGPDYIDPMFHRKVLGIPSWNLDIFFSGHEGVKTLLKEHGGDIDVAVMEGVMGYYDGAGVSSYAAGSYDLAAAADTPVILVVNGRGMSLSAAALIKGFLEFRENSNIQGVILNRISPGLYPRMKSMIEEMLPVKVVGFVPEASDCTLESRHLGLLLPDEIRDLKEKVGRLSEILQESLDLDEIIRIADGAPSLETGFRRDVSHESASWCRGAHNSEKDGCAMSHTPTIAVSRDEAFCFIYEENIEFLKKSGVKIQLFSPLHDSCLPENTDGLLLYGGYPENHAAELSSNRSMREDIREKLEKGLPCIAECGGFMYLHDALSASDGKTYEMCGVIKGNVFWTGKLTRFGYVSLRPNKDHAPFGLQDLKAFPAHEFHYFDSEDPGHAFHAVKPDGKRSWDCIHTSASLMAGFPHLYYDSCPELIKAFLQKSLEYGLKRKKTAEGYHEI